MASGSTSRRKSWIYTWSALRKAGGIIENLCGLRLELFKELSEQPWTEGRDAASPLFYTGSAGFDRRGCQCALLLSCSEPIDRWHILLIESANCNAYREAGEASIDRRNRRRTKE